MLVKLRPIVNVGLAAHRPEQILESNADADAWRLEVERVAPQLKAEWSLPLLIHDSQPPPQDRIF
jgi:hypothetical protein